MRNSKTSYFLYQELIKKGGFSVWSDYEFWLKWFENDINTNNENINNIEDFYFCQLLGISSKMQKLGIDIKTIIFCVEKIATQYIKSSDLLFELRLIIVKQFNNNKFEDN